MPLTAPGTVVDFTHILAAFRIESLLLNLSALSSEYSLLIVGVFLSAVFLFIALKLFAVLLRTLHSVKQPCAVLEIKPLQVTEQSAYSTEQLLGLINRLARQQSFWDKVLLRERVYAFELVAEKEEGIRYLARVPEDDAELVKKAVLSYLPGTEVNEVEDYLQDATSFEDKHFKVTEFKLSNHFAFPLQRQTDLAKHDPIAYMAGSMTRLAPGELLSFQILLSPSDKRLKSGETEKLTVEKHETLAAFILQSIGRLLVFLLTLPVGILVFVATGGREGIAPFSLAARKTAKVDKQLEKKIKEKLEQPLFRATVRLLTVVNEKRI